MSSSSSKPWISFVTGHRRFFRIPDRHWVDREGYTDLYRPILWYEDSAYRMEHISEDCCIFTKTASCQQPNNVIIITMIRLSPERSGICSKGPVLPSDLMIFRSQRRDWPEGLPSSHITPVSFPVFPIFGLSIGFDGYLQSARFRLR